MSIIDYLYSHSLNPETLLVGYTNGFFPMGNPDSGEIDWHCPELRAIIPLDEVKISRSLRQTLKKGHFEFRFDTAFDQVIHSCSMRFDTWISDEIIKSYTELHRLGFAHSVETWCNGDLVGGLYGVAIGGAFFGESMFSRMNDASKAAFVALIERMNMNGFTLLDSQYINHFTASLGAIEVSRDQYLTLLEKAVHLPNKLVD
ncbi:MAG: leucyl/phenylalanyl-tRNA--protein transferase [Ignavibacteria bacterium]|nr:leucyl/phenylalanyl-tRNA--protein transferase [Ignavibacteria bacterium]